MIDLGSLRAMEEYFAEHGDTPAFPMLAELYYKEKDYEHARGVCEIGLEKHPDSVAGTFILSKVELIDRNLNEAEKLLKQVIIGNPVHIYALRLLIQVQIALERSSNTIRKTIEKLLRIYPDDEECLQWQKDNDKSEDDSAEISKSSPENQEQSKIRDTEKLVSPTPGHHIKISARMATFTLAEVFKKQGNYHQALEILNMVESKGSDQNRVDKERIKIKKLIEEQEENDQYTE